MNSLAKDTFRLRTNDVVNKNSKLTVKSKQRLSKTKSENTLRAYESDWKDFADWCTHNNVPALPAAPETLVNYLSYLTDHEIKANTLSRRISAISENHKATGYIDDNPCRGGLVRSALDAIRREVGTYQQGKTPIVIETLTDLSRYFDLSTLSGIRDRALLFIGFMGALRRAELVSIDMEDISFSEAGIIILIKRSKKDQDGHGEDVAIPYNKSNYRLCAVTALKEWIAAAGIKTGSIFRPITKYQSIKKERLTNQSVALIIKKYAALAGYDAKQFAGHSLRRGFATSAAQHEVDERSIMNQTRHKSEKMVRRYIEQGNLFRNNPLKKMFDTTE